MTNELRTEVEQVKEQEDVKQAFKQTRSIKPEETPKAEIKDKLLLGTNSSPNSMLLRSGCCSPRAT